MNVPSQMPPPAASLRTASAFELTAAFYALVGSVPREYQGADRLRMLAQKLSGLTRDELAPVRQAFQRIVRQMVELGASDVDFGGPASAGRVWYRVDGAKKPYDPLGTIPTDVADALVLANLTESQRETLLAHDSCDFGYSLLIGQGDGAPISQRFRATAYFDLQHIGVCMRRLAQEALPLSSMGFHPAIERGLLFNYVRDGLTLVTGVTGSGKSTTLDAIIDANNARTHGHILIIAQPIEYIHASKKCIVRHREVGTDVASYVDGIVQGLRQDPDIVVVGEMRDAESISAALETADTGHKVFSTLHTASATETIARIVAEYPPEEQERVRYRLAEVLRCIISQRLVPTLDGGRTLAKEVLWMTSSARAAIKNGNEGEMYQMMWQGTKEGMTTLEQDLARLVRARKIATETALNTANNRRRLMQLLR